MNTIIVSLVMLLGGLAFFLYGMNIMSTGLERMAGGKMETILKKASSNKFKGMALGCGVTAVIQSSSATTVMIVGLVGSGIMTLPQTIGMLMGTNIGTTITPWITALPALGGNSADLGWLGYLKPSFFTPIIAVIGIALIMFLSKKNIKNKDIGAICLGFAILMQGMELMSGSVEGLTDNNDTFANVISWLDGNYAGIFLGLIIATLFTTIIQSSSASVGVLQALVMSGGFVMSFNVAVPLILGFNIGTCVTAVISSLAANRNAKRVAVTHLVIKIIAVLLCFIPFAICSALGADFLNSEVDVWSIAIFHTLFNVVTTAILLPFSKLIEKLAYVLMKDKESKIEVAFIDPLLIQRSPSVAISECGNLTVEMCKLSKETLDLAINNLYNYNPKTAQTIIDNESIIDKYEDRLGTYLVQLSAFPLSQADSIRISKMLHTIGDFERLSDHAINILKVSEELSTKKIVFSKEATAEIEVITNAISEILDITATSFVDNSIDVAIKVEPLEQVIDGLISGTKSNHITRLQAGACTIELGFVLSDLLNNYSRVSDHCSNIAVAIIETSHSSFGTHEYLNALKTSDDQSFQGEFNSFKKKYYLPTSQH
ncbi:MAG: Na/Pi cotransporter family protein [Ruminococcaceae bacterium]|nr:Na/Pi cotransporter family protein [Oscillospiraceae bacterium]